MNSYELFNDPAVVGFTLHILDCFEKVEFWFEFFLRNVSKTPCSFKILCNFHEKGYGHHWINVYLPVSETVPKSHSHVYKSTISGQEKPSNFLQFSCLPELINNMKFIREMNFGSKRTIPDIKTQF